jgi:hypothetical protein
MSPQIFGRGANLLARLTIFGPVLGLVALFVVVEFLVRSPWATGQGVPVGQAVPFSHKHHVGDDGIDCRYCHTSVEQSSFAGIPPTQTCMNCHSQIWSQSPMLEPVRQSAQTGQPLEWNRVHVLGDFVYFDHSIHVQKGIGCSTCHGQVDQMPLTWKAASLQMGWCLDCHRNPERYVRPREEVFNMNWQPPPNQEELGVRLVHEYAIQSKTSCSTCHR